MGELPGDGLEEFQRKGGRTEVPHVAAEHAEERLDLIGAEPDRHPFLLGAADLAPEFGREGLEQGGGVAGKVQHHRDLPVGYRQLERKGNPAPELQQLGSGRTSLGLGGGCQGANRRRVPEGATVVQEGHRHQVVSEQQTLDPHQRKHPGERAVGESGREVEALMSEDLLDHRFPAQPMKVGKAGLQGGELIPPVRGFRYPADGNGQTEDSASQRETEVNLNSASSRSRRPMVFSSPP